VSIPYRNLVSWPLPRRPCLWHLHLVLRLLVYEGTTPRRASLSLLSALPSRSERDIHSGLSLRCSDPSENEPSGVTFSFHPIPGRGDDPPSREGPALSGYDYGYSGSRPAFTPARAHPRQMPVLPVARARQRRLKADRSNSPGRSLGLAAVRSFARSLARRDSRGRAGWVYGVCCRRLDVIGPGPKCHIESDTTP
jgi:hypothetical protein